jgi:hypothetical protein
MSFGVTRARASTSASVLAFAVLFGLQIVCLIRMRSVDLVDDAPFFFRYAENLAAGHGYRWNVEEPPVWGASAPLWPLLLAFGVKLGLGAQQASMIWSWVLTLAATGLFGLVAQRLFGSLGVLALAPLLAVNFLYSFYATSGLETPLAYFLLASALAAIVYEASGVLLGVVAGLCLAHKIDFAPAGLALLAGAWIWRRPVAVKTWIVAGGVALAWYGFALWHFDSVVPNSLLSKFRMTNRWIGREWFSATLLWEGGSGLLLFLVPFGLAALRRQRYLACVTLAAFLPQVIVYTVKPPVEPYIWYAAACAPPVAFLAACGLAWLLGMLPRVQVLGERARVALGAAVLLLVTWLLIGLERPRVEFVSRYLKSIEPLRVEAGEWIAHNTPADARVYSGEGHVAYYSRRFTYDGSFLNRLPEENLIAKYQPEVLVWTLVLPEHAVPPIENYRVVQVFSAPGVERPQVCVLEKIRPEVHVPEVHVPEKARAKPRWGRALLAEIAPEHRPAARRYLLAALGSGPARTEAPPDLIAEVSRALAELCAKFETAPSRTGAPPRDVPRWFAQLEGRIAGGASKSAGNATPPR